MDLILIRTAAKLFLSLACIISGGFVFSVGEQRAKGYKNDGPYFSPYSPLKSLALREKLLLQIRSGHASESTELLSKLATRAPLDPVPFEVKLSEVHVRQNHQFAAKLSSSVLKRNPRSTAAWLYRFDMATTIGDTEKIMHNYVRLGSLKAVDQHTLDEALLGAFDENPPMKSLVDFLEVNRLGNDSLIRRLLESAPGEVDLSRTLLLYPHLQHHYVSSAMIAEEYELALRSWRFFSGIDEDLIMTHPFNGDFQMRSEPPPFNWWINSDWAEIGPQGGLDVYSRSSDRIEIAYQVLYLNPGHYKLRTYAIVDTAPSSGSLAWHVYCLPSNKLHSVVSLQLSWDKKITEEESWLEVNNSDCEFQKLALVAYPGEFTSSSHYKILQVEISDYVH